ncbi:MAG: PD-(D/E)XK nuclease family transposase, partial [Lachnospiraceae bacterium]|nr:PD-(D/E)XK nuclease family transposase [Lachnospiraceae bacterium]
MTFADDYMFRKILSFNKDLCKELLELTLGIRINRLEITENQVSMEHKFDARGIGLDIYVEDDNGSVYDIEMQ